MHANVCVCVCVCIKMPNITSTFLCLLQMGPAAPPLNQGNSALLWALWHDVDPSELFLESKETDRATTSMSLQSYESPYKYTPSFAFPSRRSHYAEVTRVRAKQNAARTKYCSTAPSIQPIVEEEEIAVKAKPSICEYILQMLNFHIHLI